MYIMKRIVMLGFVLITLYITGYAQKPFKVVFYNIENFFDLVDDPDVQDEEFTPNGPKKWTQEKYDKKLHNIERVLFDIAAINKDYPVVIGVSEVENRNVLEDIVATDLFEEEVNEGLEIYSATSLSFVKGGSDATVYVTTDQNASGIAVFDEDGNQMKVTKMSRSKILGQSIWTVKFTTKEVSKLSRVAYQVKSYDDQDRLSVDSNRIVVTVRK